MYSLREIEAFAARFYEGADLLITPYGYNLTFTSLAQSGSDTQNINIAANADFILLGLRHFAFVVGAATGINVSTKPAPSVRILITDTGSSEQFTAQAVALENYSQNDGKEVTLPYPRIVSGRTALNVQATNYSGGAGETYTFDLFFSGVLVRAYSGPGAIRAQA